MVGILGKDMEGRDDVEFLKQTGRVSNCVPLDGGICIGGGGGGGVFSLALGSVELMDLGAGVGFRCEGILLIRSRDGGALGNGGGGETADVDTVSSAIGIVSETLHRSSYTGIVSFLGEDSTIMLVVWRRNLGAGLGDSSEFSLCSARTTVSFL